MMSSGRKRSCSRPAQIDLSYGITTVRDSYGALVPLTRVRDQIARGDKVGTRVRAAGNILGWVVRIRSRSAASWVS